MNRKALTTAPGLNIVGDDVDNNPMSPRKWARIKALGHGVGRYVHVSARIGHVTGPDGLTRSFAYKRNRSVSVVDPVMVGSTYRRSGTRGQ